MVAWRKYQQSDESGAAIIWRCQRNGGRISENEMKATIEEMLKTWRHGGV